MKKEIEKKEDYRCTECKGDATLAYVPSTVKSGKNKGKQKVSWGGLIFPDERICFSCGRKRGI